MRKVLEHSQSFVDNLLYGSEALLDQYINFIQSGSKQSVDKGKVTAAMYGYLYALGCTGMLECEADQVTPARIKSRVKWSSHYQANDDARVCVEYVTRYLHQPEQQTVYHGLCEGLKKLHGSETKTVMERELAGYMGIVAFKLGVATDDRELVRAAVESIDNVANQLTKLRLHEELNHAGMLESYQQYLEHFKKKNKGHGVG